MKKIYNKFGVILTVLLCLAVAFLLWFGVEYFGTAETVASFSRNGVVYAL